MKRRSHRSSKPYWNFWKVVVAGWLIRNPKWVFAPLGFFSAFILMRLL